MTMFAVAALLVLASLALVVARAAMGPTVYDRILAGNTVGTLVVLLLIVGGFVTGRSDFVDLGITYQFLNVVGTVAILKYFRYGSLAYGPEGAPEGAPEAAPAGPAERGPA